MVMVNNTGAFVLFLLLCDACWLSTARLLHPGAEVDADNSSKISAETASSTKSQPAIIFDDEKSSNTVNVETSLSSLSSSWSSSHYSEKRKRRLRRHRSDEVDKGLVAFSADYRGPRHHPPKNN